MRIRILTLNVWNTEGDPRRLEIIIRGIRQLEPDLISLQEVVHTAGTETLDTLLADLALHATHQADVQESVPPFSERYGGTALATRWKHEVVEVLDLRLAGASTYLGRLSLRS
ncbi:MAG: endonuclease/exonuclease/phosphatase family protein [Steroidobacteraceae bacterium]